MSAEDIPPLNLVQQVDTASSVGNPYLEEEIKVRATTVWKMIARSHICVNNGGLPHMTPRRFGFVVDRSSLNVRV
jgi:hypothetical protein